MSNLPIVRVSAIFSLMILISGGRVIGADLPTTNLDFCRTLFKAGKVEEATSNILGKIPSNSAVERILGSGQDEVAFTARMIDLHSLRGFLQDEHLGFLVVEDELLSLVDAWSRRLNGESTIEYRQFWSRFFLGEFEGMIDAIQTSQENDSGIVDQKEKFDRVAQYEIAAKAVKVILLNLAMRFHEIGNLEVVSYGGRDMSAVLMEISK